MLRKGLTSVGECVSMWAGKRGRSVNKEKVAKEYLSEEIKDMREVRVWIDPTRPPPVHRKICFRPGVEETERLGLDQLSALFHFLLSLKESNKWILHPSFGLHFGIVAFRKGD